MRSLHPRVWRLDVRRNLLGRPLNFGRLIDPFLSDSQEGVCNDPYRFEKNWHELPVHSCVSRSST